MLQYPWEPHTTTDAKGLSYRIFDGVATLEELDEVLKDYCEYIIDYRMMFQVNDVIHLSIQYGPNTCLLYTSPSPRD